MKPAFPAAVAKANEYYTMNKNNISEQALIHLAATAVMDTLRTEGYDLSHPCILCGGGNNGADGLELAYMLRQVGANVTVLYLGKLYDLPTLSKKNAKQQPAAYDFDPALIGTPKTETMSEQCLAHYQKVLRAGIEVLTALPQIDPLPYSIFVDAVFGTGIQGAITDTAVLDAFDRINQSSVPVLAVDIPSGLHPDTGALDAHALYAVQTVTMQGVKPGLLLYPGAEYAGKITEADIGIESDPDRQEGCPLCLEESDVSDMLPARPARSNKGTFGRVLLVAGAPGMAGAAYFAAAAAYRMGAGLVEIVTPAKNRTVLQQLIPEAVLTCYVDKSGLKKALQVALRRADAVVLGCGLGKSKLAAYSAKYVLKHAKVPTVVDADALNIIAGKPSLLKGVSKKQKPNVLITPHPAEAARLLGKKATADTVLANVWGSAEQLCQTYTVNVLLKDAHTPVRSHDGQVTFINLSGSTALAGAGSGDILAGMLGGLLACKTNELPLLSTTALAAYLHGKAGERAEQTVGAQAAMARDILDALKK